MAVSMLIVITGRVPSACGVDVWIEPLVHADGQG
jgi:hypothetical protein